MNLFDEIYKIYHEFHQHESNRTETMTREILPLSVSV